MTAGDATDPRAEAELRLPGGYQARVLEPSPPADRDPNWYADDPTDPQGGSGLVVSPTSDGQISWDELVVTHPELEAFARERWLGARKRLEVLPHSFAPTRAALHQVAFFVVSPARHAATGRLGLRWTRGGFGTPFFGDDEQIRVEGDLLVVQRRGTVRSQRLTTVVDAAEFVGVAYRERWFEGFHDPLAPRDPTDLLHVDAVAAAALGDWFGFATAVLEELRRTDGAEAVGRVQLWPEHFDASVELGDAGTGRRASYGASPGDDAHPEPYLYVAAWGEIDRSDPYWNDTAFNGASLAYRRLLAADDQYATALAFLRRGHARLVG